MTPSHAKGTRAESAVVSFLQDQGWPYAERRTLQGTKDRGDIAGVPGIVFEVKAGSRLEIPRWLGETEIERQNDCADYGILVVKPKGIGDTRVGDWWAIKPLKYETRMLKVCGF